MSSWHLNNKITVNYVVLKTYFIIGGTFLAKFSRFTRVSALKYRSRLKRNFSEKREIIIKNVRPINTSPCWFLLENFPPRGFGLGLTRVEKHGASGWRNSHIACHSLRPFSRRKLFVKSDSFKCCDIGAKRKTNSWKIKYNYGSVFILL